MINSNFRHMVFILISELGESSISRMTKAGVGKFPTRAESAALVPRIVPEDQTQSGVSEDGARAATEDVNLWKDDGFHSQFRGSTTSGEISARAL
jgi:hypothetical protein